MTSTTYVEGVICTREALGVGKRRSVVDHHDLEVKQAAHFGDRHRHVPGADNDQPRSGQRQIEEDAHLTCHLRFMKLIELVGTRLRLALGDDARRIGQNSRLQRGPAEGTAVWLAIDDQQLLAQRDRHASRARDDRRCRHQAVPLHGVEHARSQVGAVLVPGLDENVDDPATYPVGAHRDLVCQVDHHHARLVVLHDFERRAPHFRFTATAADRAVSGAVRANEHACADLARRAAASAHDSRNRDARRRLERLVEGGVEVAGPAQR